MWTGSTDKRKCLEFPAGEADLVRDSEIEKIPGVSAVTFGAHPAVMYADRPAIPVFGTRSENTEVEVTISRP